MDYILVMVLTFLVAYALLGTIDIFIQTSKIESGPIDDFEIESAAHDLGFTDSKKAFISGAKWMKKQIKK